MIAQIRLAESERVRFFCGMRLQGVDYRRSKNWKCRCGFNST